MDASPQVFWQGLLDFLVTIPVARRQLTRISVNRFKASVDQVSNERRYYRENFKVSQLVWNTSHTKTGVHIDICRKNRYIDIYFLQIMLENHMQTPTALLPKVAKLSSWYQKMRMFWNLCKNNYSFFYIFSFNKIFILSFWDLQIFERKI